MFCLNCQFAYGEKQPGMYGYLFNENNINDFSKIPFISSPVGVFRVGRGVLMAGIGLISMISSAIFNQAKNIEKPVNITIWGFREATAGVFITIPLINTIAMRYLGNPFTACNHKESQ